MEKVLIYGYGWSGQSALSLFSAIGFECVVVDECLDFSGIRDYRFLKLHSALKEDFALVLVCIINDIYAQEAMQKLENAGLNKDKIRLFQSYEYKSKMVHLVRRMFGSADEVLRDCLEDSLKMPVFQAKIGALKSAYHKDKIDSIEELMRWGESVRERNAGRSVFAMLYDMCLSKSSVGHISYPCFNVGISHFKQEDKDFYFIKKVDFESLQKRGKDKKLIACFGNSALRCEYLPLEETITHYLQELLGDEYLVVNFGITGYTLYEMLMLYNALVFTLKPEVTLCFFGGTDFRVGFGVCDKLLKTHFINYSPYFYEGEYKAFVGSDLPLYCEGGASGAVNKNISKEDIINSMIPRLEQFNAITSAGGGGGISCLYPAPSALQVRVA